MKRILELDYRLIKLIRKTSRDLSRYEWVILDGDVLSILPKYKTMSIINQYIELGVISPRLDNSIEKYILDILDTDFIMRNWSNIII